ncbi:MAG: FlgD immunoglobulin-like domain containing protein [Candidatus Cloacimonadota bacterium]|nr:FlgD immunoglobulin-like domain containing protein [Candidatus Cloacimonadota bacterium]
MKNVLLIILSAMSLFLSALAPTLSEQVSVPYGNKCSILEESGNIRFYDYAIEENTISISSFVMNTNLEFTEPQQIYSNTFTEFDSLFTVTFFASGFTWNYGNKSFLVFQNDQELTSETEFILLSLTDENVEVFQMDIKPVACFGDNYIICHSMNGSINLSNLKIYDVANSEMIDIGLAQENMFIYYFNLVDDEILIVNYGNDSLALLEFYNLDLELIASNDELGGQFFFLDDGIMIDDHIYAGYEFMMSETGLVDITFEGNEVVYSFLFFDTSETCYTNLTKFSDNSFIFTVSDVGATCSGAGYWDIDLEGGGYWFGSSGNYTQIIDFSDEYKMAFANPDGLLELAILSTENLENPYHYSFDVDDDVPIKSFYNNDDYLYFLDTYSSTVNFIYKLNFDTDINEDVVEAAQNHISNFPNPFNPSTTIDFSLPEGGMIDVSIYNIKGQKVKTLLNQGMEEGNHQIQWHGKDESGNSVSSGVYFYKIKTNQNHESINRMLLLK